MLAERRLSDSAPSAKPCRPKQPSHQWPQPRAKRNQLPVAHHPPLGNSRDMKIGFPCFRSPKRSGRSRLPLPIQDQAQARKAERHRRSQLQQTATAISPSPSPSPSLSPSRSPPSQTG